METALHQGSVNFTLTVVQIEGPCKQTDAAFRTYKELTWYNFRANEDRRAPPAVRVHNLEQVGQAPGVATQPAGQLFALQKEQ